MNRIWKDVIGYEGIYQVSNDGLIKSLERICYHRNGKSYKLNERLLTLKLPKNAKYYQVILYKDYGYKLHRIHRLVGEAFLYKENDNLEINHKDGNKLNNNLSNLEWVTKSENIIHSHNVLNQDNGENRYNSKLKSSDIFEIRNSNLSQIKLAEKYNVSKTCIQHIKTYKSWKQVKE
jgi:hypothetical protein